MLVCPYIVPQTAVETPVEGIPFWGFPGDAENYIKPDYSAALPASYSYDGDPTPTITVAWRTLADHDVAGADFDIEGVTSGWRVTAVSEYSTIAVDDFYNNLDSLIADMMNEASGTVILPAVGVNFDTTAGVSITNSTQPPGSHIIVQGAVDVDGFQDTHFAATANSDNFFTVNITNDIDVWLDIRNLRCGPSDAEITAGGTETGTFTWGGAMLNHVAEYGKITARNCWCHRTSDNGISSSRSTCDEWTKRQNAVIELYDTYISASGATEGSQHNLYTHALKLLLGVRCFSGSASTHAWKTSDDRCLMLNCIFSGEPVYMTAAAKSGRNRPVDVTGMVESYAYQCVVAAQQNASSRFQIGYTPRYDVFSSLNSRHTNLAYFKRQTGDGESQQIEWVTGGLQNCNHNGARLTNSELTSATVIELKEVGQPYPATTLNRNLGNGVAVDIQIVLDSGSVHTTTGTTSGAGSGTVTVTIAAGLPSAAAANNAAVVKLSANAWDLPLLNEPCHNSAHVDYPWASLDNGSGQTDLTSPYIVPQIVDRCIFTMHSSGSVDGKWVGNSHEKTFVNSWTNANRRITPPLPPTNATNSEWGDIAGSAEFTTAISGTWPLNGTAATGGTGRSGSAWVDPMVVALCNLLQYDENVSPNGYGSQFRIDEQSSALNPWRPAQEVGMWWLGSGGAMTFNGTDGSSPMPAPVQNQLNGAETAGATVITVDDATGISTGDEISISMTGGPWGQEWFFTTVAGVSGNDITLGASLPFDAADNSPISAVTPAGAKPAWWPDINEWAA